jgi:hypothetical protein
LFFVTAQRDGTALAYCEDPERPICGLKVAVFSPHILARLRPLQMPPEEPLAPPRTMAALHLECDSDNHCIWWKMQEDLLRHLDRHIRPQDRPFLLGFMNILPYHFGLEPPRGVPAWLDVGRNLSLEAHPEPRAMLADATLVVVPHMKEEIGYFPELMAIYGETIRSSFTVVEQNPLWSIWRRD